MRPNADNNSHEWLSVYQFDYSTVEFILREDSEVLKQLGLPNAPLSSCLEVLLVQSHVFVFPHSLDDAVGEVSFV